MPNPLEPEVVEPAKEEKPARPRRAQVRYKIRHLPPAVHRELDRRFESGDYASFEELSRWLENDHQQYISPSSLHNYFRTEFDPTLQAVKIATAQAAEIVRVSGADADDDQLGLALFRLVQTAIFDLLVQLNRTRQLLAMVPDAAAHSANRRALTAARSAGSTSSQDQPLAAEADAPKFINKVELAAIAALGKVVAMVNRAALDDRKFRVHIRERLEAKIAATQATVSKVAREGGLSAKAEEKIRNALMEIKL